MLRLSTKQKRNLQQASQKIACGSHIGEAKVSSARARPDVNRDSIFRECCEQVFVGLIVSHREHRRSISTGDDRRRSQAFVYSPGSNFNYFFSLQYVDRQAFELNLQPLDKFSRVQSSKL